MLCYFQSECVFYFFKHTQYTQRYGKSYRTYTKNCFFGKFESKYVKSSYNSYVYNHYDDYDELSQRDGYRHYSTPPRPNTFNFESSTFIQLTTKLTEENKKVNVTGSMINGLHLGPQKTNWYGKCQGAGIHVITNTTWDLDFKLVYKDNKPCFFKILRLVKGYMKLRIPNSRIVTYYNTSLKVIFISINDVLYHTTCMYLVLRVYSILIIFVTSFYFILILVLLKRSS